MKFTGIYGGFRRVTKSDLINNGKRQVGKKIGLLSV
jgi:hypothetical protein